MNKVLKEVIEKINGVISKQINESGYNSLITLDALSTKTIFKEVWGCYPTLHEYSCQYIDTGEKIMKECKDVVAYGMYVDHDSEENGTTKTIGCIYVGDKIIIGYHYRGIYVLSMEDADVSWVEKYLVTESQTERPNTYWVSVGQQGFGKTLLNIKKDTVDVNAHYNDDLDMDRINGFLTSEDSGLIILHGAPGTGKTYLIRHLAYEHKNKTFLFIDSSMLNQINSSDFISFLYGNRNSIIVFEDCETLLRKRISNNGLDSNSLLKTLLNLSDGILGDGLGLKFICTFNADLSEIDDAIKRRGRLNYRYEFGKLCKEKADALCKKRGIEPVGEDTYLCEIFNPEDNGAENKKPKFKGLGL